MRRKIIMILLISGLCIGCIKKEKENILNSANIIQLLGFSNSKFPAKPQIKKSFVFNNNFCYSQLDLFVDSTFFKQTRCESNLHFSYGKWRINKDSLALTYTPLNKFNMIVDCSLKGDTSEYFVLKIITQNHLPINNFELIGFKKGTSIKSSLKYGCLLTDKRGIIRIKKTDFDSISISSFKNITHKVLNLKSFLLPDTMNLVLFFNSTNFSPFPIYDYHKNSSVYIIKNGDLIPNKAD